jgi:hypothetical protein
MENCFVASRLTKQYGEKSSKVSRTPSSPTGPNGTVPRTPVVEKPENAAAREPEYRAGGLKNRCNWWAAAIPMPGSCLGSARARFRRSNQSKTFTE